MTYRQRRSTTFSQRRRTTGAVLVGACLLVAVACTSGHSPTAAPPTTTIAPPRPTSPSFSVPTAVPSTLAVPRTLTATRIVIYQPFTTTGAVATGFVIASQFRGANCWEGAVATPRSDAFRCALGNSIHDPCILDPVGAPRLACPNDYDPSRILIVTPTSPFPTYPNHGAAPIDTGLPWLLQLDNGQMCDPDTGASAYFPSVGRANWDCRDGFGWGSIRRDSPIWTLPFSGQSLASSTPPELTELSIATAWI